ncbi:MAG TPA: FtsX-like permease family protein [Candidatus Avimuribaculum pullicola]|nr:FtsX-like permease family protein [Candidatus Avimuribaculum pullicola]
MNNFTLKIALRYLKSKKTHNAVNIISIVAMCGVVVTTAAMVCVLSVFNGFSSLIGSKLAKLDPPIMVNAASGKAISNADSLVAAIASIDGVEMALPTISDHALAVYDGMQMPVLVKGVPDGYEHLTGINDVIIDGNYTLDSGSLHHAVLSVGVALQLRARPGFVEGVRILAPKRIGNINLANPAGAFRADTMQIAGVYQVEQSDYDRDMIYVPIEAARFLFNYPTEATSIEISPSQGADEARVMDAISSIIGDGYTVKDRLMQQAYAYRMVNIEKWVTFLLLGFIMVIATFNVIGTLSLLIIEKDASITTFRNMGATNKQITRIFITEGWLISLVGAVAGIAIGLILCWAQQTFGLIELQGATELLVVKQYPVEVQMTDLVVVFAAVAVVGLLTSMATSIVMRRKLHQ